MNLQTILKEDNIFIANSYEDTDTFYSDFAVFLKERGIIEDNEKVKRLFIKRENVQSTAIGKGAAAPHIFSDEFESFTFCLALIRDGMDFKAPDEGNVHLIFLIMSDDRDVGLHLKTLAHIARLVNSTAIVESTVKANDAAAIIKIVGESEKLV